MGKLRNWWHGDREQRDRKTEEWLEDRGYTLRDLTGSPDDDLDSKRSDDDYKSKQSSYSRSVPDGVTNVSTHGAQTSSQRRVTNDYEGYFSELSDIYSDSRKKADTRQSAVIGTIASLLGGGIATGSAVARKVIQAMPAVSETILNQKDNASVPDVAEAPIELPDGKPNIIVDDNGVSVPTQLPDVSSTLDSASSHLINNIPTDNVSSSSRGSNLARFAITGFDALGNLLSNEHYKRQQQSLINQMNEYNTPANQMQRYKDAGLNPNLIAGQISAGNQSSSGEPHAMQLHPIDALTAVSNVNLQAAQADEIRERAISQRNSNSLFAYDSVLKALSIDELQSRINKQIKELELIDSQHKLNNAQTKSLNDLRQTEKELKQAQTKLAQIQEQYTPKNASSIYGRTFSDIWDTTWSILNIIRTAGGTNDKAPVPNRDILSRKFD